MHHPDIDAPLLALRCGRLSPDVFARRTHGLWTAQAKKLLQRWRGPVAVDVDDLRQELLLNAWIACGHWNPERGVTITRFVLYNAIDKAKKWLHQQRNAYRRDDKAPARMERNFSSFHRDTGDSADNPEERLLQGAATEPTAEEAFSRRQLLVAAVLRAPNRHVPAMVALAQTGDIDLAALALKASTAACVALRLETVADARLAVVHALQAVA